MYVVIMGCGRVGSSLASGLERLGHEVAVIDRNAQAFRRLGPEFRGRQVVGEGYHRDVLAEAGVERAHAFAAVSSGDNSNIIAARVARESYGVERVVARIYDAKRAVQTEAPRIETRAEPIRNEIVRSEPIRSDQPIMQRALAPLFGGQPAQRADAAQVGAPAPMQRGPLAPAQPDTLSGQPGQSRAQAPSAQRTAQGAAAIQQSIARIHEASQAPTLSPQLQAQVHASEKHSEPAP